MQCHSNTYLFDSAFISHSTNSFILCLFSLTLFLPISFSSSAYRTQPISIYIYGRLFWTWNLKPFNSCHALCLIETHCLDLFSDILEIDFYIFTLPSYISLFHSQIPTKLTIRIKLYMLWFLGLLLSEGILTVLYFLEWAPWQISKFLCPSHHLSLIFLSTGDHNVLFWSSAHSKSGTHLIMRANDQTGKCGSKLTSLSPL